MSTSPAMRPGRSATADDCARLWIYLTDQFIPKLQLEIDIVSNGRPNTIIRISVVDYARVTDGADLHKSTWATRDFSNPLYLISISQLFDLLILAHNNISAFFTTGVDNRPSPLKD